METARGEEVMLVPAPDEQEFGRRLQKIRKRRGLSQSDVAQRLGIHQSLVSQYERGYLRLHGALIARLAVALGTTPNDILATTQAPTNGQHEPQIDRRFLRRLQRINGLSDHDKRLLLGTIDAFLSKGPATNLSKAAPTAR